MLQIEEHHAQCLKLLERQKNVGDKEALLREIGAQSTKKEQQLEIRLKHLQDLIQDQQLNLTQLQHLANDQLKSHRRQKSNSLSRSDQLEALAKRQEELDLQVQKLISTQGAKQTTPNVRKPTKQLTSPEQLKNEFAKISGGVASRSPFSMFNQPGRNAPEYEPIGDSWDGKSHEDGTPFWTDPDDDQNLSDLTPEGME